MKFLERQYIRLLRLWWRATVLRVTRPGLMLVGSIECYGRPIVSIAPRSTIEIGERVVLCSDARFTALGVSHPVILRTLAPGAIVRIGRDTGISGATICAIESVVIGDECLLGADVMIVDTDFHPLAPLGRRYSRERPSAKPVVIEDNVFVGARSIIMKGVRIGRNSVVGAGSVVVHDLPPNCIAAGVPARVVRTLDGDSEMGGGQVVGGG